MSVNKFDEDVLFLGGIYPQKIYNIYTNPKINQNIQNAANVLQCHLIGGIENVLGRSIKIVNAPYIGVFPKSCKILYSKMFYFKHCNDRTDVNVGFLNVPIWRHISIFLHSCSQLKHWTKKNECGSVIAYALTLRNVYRLLYVKKKNSNIKTCIIVPDLPMYMRETSNKVYIKMKALETKLIKRHLREIDAYVLLTEHMNEFISAEHYCVVEGIATETSMPLYSHCNNKIIFYGGALDIRYGVVNLINAFTQISGDEYKLFICGKGESEKYIKTIAEKDQRIHYLGQIRREEALNYQKKATVLVNPRQNIGEYTKYSFPSKNLEYLSSGIPLIAYKLDGIPNEYDDYIQYVNDNTVEALRDKIVEVCEYSDDERKQIGIKAREFVLQKKNKTTQAEHIINMLSEL